MRAYKIEGIVIKRTNFGEADRILTIFTKKSGKIKVKALGVRKITSRRASHIELLNYSLLTLYKGKSLSILTEAQTVENFLEIKSDLLKVGFSYHICELVDGLCAENQENQDVFDLLKNTLNRLSKEDDIALIVHEFEISLLSALGFFPRTNTKDFDHSSYIESILERKLKARQILNKLN